VVRLHPNADPFLTSDTCTFFLSTVCDTSPLHGIIPLAPVPSAGQLGEGVFSAGVARPLRFSSRATPRVCSGLGFFFSSGPVRDGVCVVVESHQQLPPFFFRKSFMGPSQLTVFCLSLSCDYLFFFVPTRTCSDLPLTPPLPPERIWGNRTPGHLVLFGFRRRTPLFF